MKRLALAVAGLVLAAQAVAGAQAPPRQTPPPPQPTRPTPPARPGAQAPAPPRTGRPNAPPTGTERPAPTTPTPPTTPATPAQQGVTTLPGTTPVAPPPPSVPLPPVSGVIATDALAKQGYVAGKAPGRSVSLSQAVDLVLKYQPRVAIAAQNVLSARANLLQARGVFDPVFTFNPGGDYTQQPVAPGFLRQQKNNRTLMKQLHVGFTRANIQLRDILAGTRTALPTCPLAFDFEFGSGTNNDGIDPSEVAVSGVNRDVFPFVLADLEASLGGINLRQFCAGPLGGNPLDAILFDLSYGRLIAIDQGRPFGLDGVLASGIEAPFESVRLLAEISEAVAARARLALERLGPLPKDQFTRHVSIRTGINKPFRNGLTANVELLLEAEENNFRDKILDPTFGGAGFAPRFPSSITAGLIVPLGRGRGSAGTDAQERSARFSLAARQEQIRHVATEEVYRTLLAYIRLIAAQENVKLAQTSSERQTTIVGLVDQRVRGGESARVDSFRAQARAATVGGSLASSQAELVDARMSLAEAMGLDAGSLAEAPAASDGFADVKVDAPTVSALIASAMESRRDRLALDQARRASAELARGARADSRRTYDINLSAGFADAYESEIFRYLSDERNPIFSELNPPKEFDDTNRFYSPRGWARSLSGRWEPFVTASISFDLPLGNNAAKGRLAQAQATLRSSEIQYGDRTRLIGDTLTGLVSTVRAAAEGVLRAREAVGRSQASLDGTFSQLRAGESTVIDTLNTEADLLNDQTALIRAQQLYLSALARLRFESGQLVSFSGLGEPAESLRFVPTDFVVR
jgi:outer membrane protein TolC